ncbi:hypothetical protein EJB05_26065, partial [Eragrostis curvula]
MSTVNNWVPFSLFPQGLPLSQTDSAIISAATTDDVSGDVCFNIPQVWSMRGSGLSEPVAEQKLEDFLGGISFSEQHRKATSSNMVASSSSTSYASSRVSAGYQDPSLALQFADPIVVVSSPGADEDGIGVLSAATAAPNGVASAAGDNGGNIGLSVDKNWLLNQPASPPPNTRAEAADCAHAAELAFSLYMNMGDAEATGMLHLAGMEQGRETESLSAEPVQGATALAAVSTDTGGSGASFEATAAMETVHTFGQRTSIYRGVTRYEAHLWDNSFRREGQTRKGRQGGYDNEDKAARAYDLAALKYWGPTTATNFPVAAYEMELEEMKHMTRQELVAKSSGFSRGASIYRGVTRHQQPGRWQARIGSIKLNGTRNRDLYLGTFDTQEAAAEAYDIAAIKFRGLNAMTNFDISRYDVKSIVNSSEPTGRAAKRLKQAYAASASAVASAVDRKDAARLSSQLGDCAAAAAVVVSNHVGRLDSRLVDGEAYATIAYGGHSQHAAAPGWPNIAFQPAPAHHAGLYHPYAPPLRWWGCKQEQDHAVIAAAHSLQELHHLNLGAAAPAGANDFFSPAGPMQSDTNSIDNASLERNTSLVVYKQ